MRTRIKPLLHVLGGHMPIYFFHLAYVMRRATFQHAVLGIFADLIHDCVDVYMDDFTAYGNTFQEALDNLEKVLI